MEVTVNLNGVFAQINNAKELKETTNNIIQQLSTAYNARLAELMPQKAAPVVVDTTPSTKGKKSTPAETKNTAKGEFEGVPEADEQEAAPAKKSKGTKKSEPAKDAAKATKPEKEKPARVEQVKIASLTKAQIKAMNIHFEEYNEKCMLLIGETKSIKEDIKTGGWAKWYDRSGDERHGWLINKTYARKLAQALKIKIA